MNAERMNTIFTRSTSEKSLLVLQSLIGKVVGRILSPCLQVAGPHLTSPSWSIPVSEQDASGWHHSYIVIRCEWFETPELLTDYWEFIASDKINPKAFPSIQRELSWLHVQFISGLPLR